MPLRSILFVIVVVVVAVSSAEAFAGDYTVSYAFDGATSESAAGGTTSSPRDEGSTKECWYEEPCTIELTKSDIKISLNVQRLGRHKVAVFADGGLSRGPQLLLFWRR